MKINRRHIENASLFVRKWAVRLLVTTGAAATFVACHSSKKAPANNPDKPVPPYNDPRIIPQPLVYGPPQEQYLPIDTLRKPMPEPLEPVYGAPMPQPRLDNEKPAK